MEMAGQEEIDSTIPQTVDGHRGTSDQGSLRIRLRKIKRMMGNDNLGDGIRQTAEALIDARYLPVIDPSALERQGSSRVHSQDGELVVGIKGFEIVGDIAAISFELLQPRSHIVEGNIVVAWNDDFDCRQGIQKITCRFELFIARPLREVAGHGDDVGSSWATESMSGRMRVP